MYPDVIILAFQEIVTLNVTNVLFNEESGAGMDAKSHFHLELAKALNVLFERVKYQTVKAMPMVGHYLLVL